MRRYRVARDVRGSVTSDVHGEIPFEFAAGDVSTNDPTEAAALDHLCTQVLVETEGEGENARDVEVRLAEYVDGQVDLPAGAPTPTTTTPQPAPTAPPAAVAPPTAGGLPVTPTAGPGPSAAAGPAAPGPAAVPTSGKPGSEI